MSKKGHLGPLLFCLIVLMKLVSAHCCCQSVSSELIVRHGTKIMAGPGLEASAI